MAIVRINNGQSGNPAMRFAKPLDIIIEEGQQVAIVGDNAAGKTRLVETLSGRYPLQGQTIEFNFGPGARPLISQNIKYVAFRDSYGDADSGYYLQQRWNQQDIDEETPTVASVLQSTFEMSGADEACRDRLLAFFGLERLMDQYIISLSSGELRKFQLAKALMSSPRMLILDNPFIGLDASARDSLAELLAALAETSGILIIPVLSKLDVIPSFVTHVIRVEGLDVMPMVRVQDFRLPDVFPDLEEEKKAAIAALPQKVLPAFYPSCSNAEIVRCEKVSIRYGHRTILRELDWSVREGEKWVIAGPNGSGKSTLLSLVCADNPQSYACKISLFGHKRGSGESIWEIKRHIGYVSPEMHRAWQKNLPAIDIVASGLFDTVGMCHSASGEQLEVCRKWMDIFGIAQLADRSFLRLSSGEQRLCLLARAFVKDPELLVLDEPLHGLDLRHCKLVKQIIDAFMQRQHKTLLLVSHYASEIPSCIDHRLEL